MYGCVARKKTATDHRPKASTPEAIQGLLALLRRDGFRCRRVRLVLCWGRGNTTYFSDCNPDIRLVLSRRGVILLLFPNVIPRSLPWVKNLIREQLGSSAHADKCVAMNLLTNICFVSINLSLI